MENLTVVVPFYNGHEHIERLLWSLPNDMPIVIVDDLSDQPLRITGRANVRVIRMERKGYFSGAVNAGIAACKTDVLVLNQDTWLAGDEWQNFLAISRDRYAMIGERIRGMHPAFPEGYIHGTFMFMRRDAINKVGNLNHVDFPLWGATAEWQWRVARAGFRVLPMATIPGFHHARGEGQPYGSSIAQLLRNEPDRQDLLVRTPPLVSVVIPSFNQGKYLQDAVNSLIGGPTSLGSSAGQTLQAFEVIIVDDGSPNAESRELAQAQADPWKGVSFIQLRQNAGAAAAQNAGIAKASGRYITVIDGDDMREPHALAALYRACVANPGMVAYDDVRTFANGERGKVMRMPDTYDFDILIEKNQMHKGIMFSRKAWQAVGGYPEQMRQGREDWAFNVALGRAGYCGVHVSGAGYLYRREGQNRTLRNTSPEWRDYFMDQLRGLFPDVYNGERPMACCGKGKVTPPAPQPRALTKGVTIQRSASAQAPTGFVQIEYLGNNYGSTVWGGPGAAPSGRSYTFGAGATDRIKYVDPRDAQWFANLREGGRNVFAQVRVEPVAPPMSEPEPEEAEPLDNLSSGAEEVHAPALPDPADLTVTEIKALDLTPVQWDQLLAAERAGKNRATAVEYMESQLVD